MKSFRLVAVMLALFAPRVLSAETAPVLAPLDTDNLHNPVWSGRDNLRDPSVLKTKEGYYLFYSRLSGGWGDPKSWAIACVFTRDFVHFENDHDISPKGFASPGDVLFWHGRYLIPYQSYPANPSRLCYSESLDLKHWSEPKWLLAEAGQLPWNDLKRVIDPSFVVEGGRLHCFFIGSAKAAVAGGKANLMGHAVTNDPKLEKWKILTPDAPMIGVSESAPDGVENTMVIRTGDRWSMIYSEGLAAQHLALATSDDLCKWDLKGSIKVGSQNWLAKKYGAPFIWRDGSRWVMILMGTNSKDRTTFGLLTSPDGKAWTLLPE